ncbi:DNA polymerase III subunit delta [Pelotomaculum sp. PtaB.Bin117]|uniref:DNA polymerase III subunit delta n=1 Tax=Pelotomaculum sp. PtaB.Bin117 TaxID=1811694 RepID=UPI0009D178EC|nr:DNA polymerase III subunit delta [Pelotomaculum sp. PtaB.Bin117]OPX87051.1 MAG: DNA polymerase III subunit delta [Pelotomaculum sp. PtaB.Bin117]
MDYFIELLNSLKRRVVAPIYIFYGEETYLQEQAVFHFKNSLIGDSAPDLNYDLMDGQAVTPAEIAARAETVPFFADRRLVVVREAAFFKTARPGTGESEEVKEEVKAPDKERPLLDYLKNPLTSTCLVFTIRGPVDKRKKIFQLIRKNGRAIDFTYLNRRDLGRWLEQKAVAANRCFTPEAAAAFLDSAGPSLQKLVTELDKLINYTAGCELISWEDVTRLCQPRAEDNIFVIVDALGNKRCREALSGIKEILAAKEPPQRLLAMISRQFRLLLQVQDMIERGYPAREIPARLKMPPYVFNKIAAQSKNFDHSRLAGALEDLQELDVAVKSGRQQFYPALETYLLKLCT